ncbi:HAMP domain-containing protein [Candidatus Magnetomoraceae bacterium gMMP-15]
MKILRNKRDWDGKERRAPERIIRMRMKSLKGKFHISNIRKRLLIYFFLIIFVTFSVNIQLIFEIGNNRLHTQISESMNSQPSEHQVKNQDTSGVQKILKKLQYRMILVTIIVFLCVIATMFVFIHNIVEPMDEMARVTKKMADGNLDEPVPVRNHDEIGKIAELINDLAMNLQEILLYVWNQTGQSINTLKKISEKSQSLSGKDMPHEIKEDFISVQQDIEDMREMIKAFDFYDVKLDDGKIVSDEKEEWEY